MTSENAKKTVSLNDYIIDIGGAATKCSVTYEVVLENNTDFIIKRRTLKTDRELVVLVTACDDYDDRAYLLYQPSYPWQLTEADLALTEEHLVSVFRRYVGMLTDEEVEVAYQEVENGG